MASFNKVILLGNVTRDIELRHTQSGTALCDIGLAVNDRVKKGDEWVEEATFVDCTAWARTAEVASEYLTKGAPVLIEGRLKLDQWTDKESGEKRSKIKVLVDRLQLIGSKKDRGGDEPAPAPRRQAAQRPTDNFYQQAVEAGFQPTGTPDSEIPF